MQSENQINSSTNRQKIGQEQRQQQFSIDQQDSRIIDEEAQQVYQKFLQQISQIFKTQFPKLQIDIDSIQKQIDKIWSHSVKRFVEIITQNVINNDQQDDYRAWVKINSLKIQSVIMNIQQSKSYKTVLNNKIKEREQNMRIKDSLQLNQQQSMKKDQILDVQKKRKIISQNFQRISKENNKYPNPLLEYLLELRIFKQFMKFYKIYCNNKDDNGLKQLEILEASIKITQISLTGLKESLRKQNRMKQQLQKAIQVIQSKQIEIQQFQTQQIKKTQKYQKILLQNVELYLLLKKKIIQFDIYQLQSLILQNQQSEKYIQGKNIIFLVGPSGAGKTTIVLRLLKYKLVKGRYQDIDTLKTQNKVDKSHENLISRPGYQSVTKTIFCTLLRKASQPSQALYICDTPGFFDSKGPLVDIANSISLINTIKKAKSVKIAVVIQKNLVGDRFQGIVDLGKIISNLMSKFEKYEEGRSVCFIFNKFNNKIQELLQLQRAVVTIKNSLSQEQKSDKKFVTFLQLLASQLSSNKSQALLNFNPFQIDTRKFIKTLSQNPLQNPSEAFQYLYISKSNQKLQLFIQKKISLIHNYLQIDCHHSCYHILQLKQLADILKDNRILNRYQEVKEQIVKKNLQYFNDFQLFLFGQEWKSNLTEGTISMAMGKFHKLKNFQIFKVIQKMDIKCSQDAIKQLYKKNQQSLESIKKKILSYQLLTIEQQNIVRSLSLICKNFGSNYINQIAEILQENKKIMEEKFKKLSSDDSSIKQVADMQMYLYNISCLLQKEKQEEIVKHKQTIENKYNQFFQRYQEIIQKFIGILQCKQNEKQDLNNIQGMMKQFDYYNRLKSFEAVKHQFLQNKRIIKIDIINDLKHAVKNIKQKSKRYIRQSSFNSCNKLQVILRILQRCQKIDQLSVISKDMKQKINESLKKHFQKNKETFLKILEQLQKRTISPQIVKIESITHTLVYFMKIFIKNDDDRKQILQENKGKFIQAINGIIKQTNGLEKKIKNRTKQKNEVLDQLSIKLLQLQLIQKIKGKEGNCAQFVEMQQSIGRLGVQIKKIRDFFYSETIEWMHLKQQQINSDRIQRISQNIQIYGLFRQKNNNNLTSSNQNLENELNCQLKKSLQMIGNYCLKQQEKCQSNNILQLSINEQNNLRQLIKKLQNLTIKIKNMRFQNQLNQQLQKIQSTCKWHKDQILQIYKSYSKIKLMKQSQKQLPNLIKQGKQLLKYQQYLGQQTQSLKQLLADYISQQQRCRIQQLQTLFSKNLISDNQLVAFYDKNNDNMAITTKFIQKFNDLSSNLQNQLQKKEHKQVKQLISCIQDIIKVNLIINKLLIDYPLLEGKIANKIQQQTIQSNLKIVIKDYIDQFSNIAFKLLSINYPNQRFERRINQFSRIQQLFSKYSDIKSQTQGQLQNISKQIQLITSCFYDFTNIKKNSSWTKYLLDFKQEISKYTGLTISQILDPLDRKSKDIYKHLNQGLKTQYYEKIYQEIKKKKNEIYHLTQEDFNNKVKVIQSIIPSQIRQKFEHIIQDIISERNKYAPRGSKEFINKQFQTSSINKKNIKPKSQSDSINSSLEKQNVQQQSSFDSIFQNIIDPDEKFLQEFNRINTINKKDYRKAYKQFKTFNQILSEFENSQQRKTMKEKIKHNIKQNIQKQNPQKIIAMIFALYSLLKQQQQKTKQFRRPYISQVIAIIALLDPHEDREKLTNKIAQMPSGEGKSIVAGIVAAYLALRGFKVYYKCLTPLLVKISQRQFNSLFQQLNIKDQIKCGVFDDICNQLFQSVKLNENRDQNISIEKWFQQTILKIRNILSNIDSKSILLFDQIDSLISNQHPNSLFYPTFQISDQIFGEHLVSDVFFQIREHKLNQRNNLKILENCNDNYYKNILVNSINKIYNSYIYQRQIYQNQQQIMSLIEKFKGSTQIYYEQCWAGFMLFKQGRITQQCLRKKLKLKISFCQLSYSEVPKYFSSIIGVSGTYSQISQNKKDKLKLQYKVCKVLVIPSTSDKSNLTTLQMRFEIQETQFFQGLLKCLGLKQQNRQSGEHFLVLFKNQTSLLDFKRYLEQKNLYTKQFNILDEETLQKTDELIRLDLQKVNSSRITLATKMYSFGIDYQDKEQSEGLFVILTYIPDSKQSYVQARGRTARKGKKGKFLLFAKQENTHQFSQKQLHKMILQRQSGRINELKMQTIKLKSAHDKSIDLFRNDNKPKLIEYLQKLSAKFHIIMIPIVIQLSLLRDQQIARRIIRNISDQLTKIERILPIYISIRLYVLHQDKYQDQRLIRIHPQSILKHIDRIIEYNLHVNKNNHTSIFPNNQIWRLKQLLNKSKYQWQQKMVFILQRNNQNQLKQYFTTQNFRNINIFFIQSQQQYRINLFQKHDKNSLCSYLTMKNQQQQRLQKFIQQNIFNKVLSFIKGMDYPQKF